MVGVHGHGSSWVTASISTSRVRVSIGRSCGGCWSEIRWCSIGCEVGTVRDRAVRSNRVGRGNLVLAVVVEGRGRVWGRVGHGVRMIDQRIHGTCGGEGTEDRWGVRVVRLLAAVVVGLWGMALAVVVVRVVAGLGTKRRGIHGLRISSMLEGVGLGVVLRNVVGVGHHIVKHQSGLAHGWEGCHGRQGRRHGRQGRRHTGGHGRSIRGRGHGRERGNGRDGEGRHGDGSGGGVERLHGGGVIVVRISLLLLLVLVGSILVVVWVSVVSLVLLLFTVEDAVESHPVEGLLGTWGSTLNMQVGAILGSEALFVIDVELAGVGLELGDHEHIASERSGGKVGCSERHAVRYDLYSRTWRNIQLDRLFNYRRRGDG